MPMLATGRQPPCNYFMNINPTIGVLIQTQTILKQSSEPTGERFHRFVVANLHQSVEPQTIIPVFQLGCRGLSISIPSLKH